MTAPVAAASPRTLVELADDVLATTADGAPAWLTAPRQEAARWITGRGFPDRKHEDWRYVDLKPVLATPFTPAAGVFNLTSAELSALAGPRLSDFRLVVVNGRLDERLSDRAGTPGGVRVSTLASDGRLGAGCEHVHAFEALNAALALGTVMVEIAGGSSVDVPIEIVYVTAGAGDTTVVFPRTLIDAGPGSAATIVETYVGTGPGPSMTNGHTTVLVGPAARVEHYKLQNEPDDAFHLSTLQVEPDTAAVFASHLLAVGARLGRHEVRAYLAGDDARIDLDGLFVTGGEQCHDNPVVVEHLAPRCASRLLYKGIVADAGHGIFNGRVLVKPDAVGTDAQQTNKNLLLSDRAEVDTRPRLEIFADDVSVTHGASVGQLDPDALFYLRSRGIPEPAACSLLISGFATEIVGRYPNGVLGERAERIIAARLDHETELV